MKKKSRAEQIEIAKLKLAFLKENRFYREAYNNIKTAINKNPMTDYGYLFNLSLGTIENCSNEEYCVRHPNMALALFFLHCVTHWYYKGMPEFARSLAHTVEFNPDAPGVIYAHAYKGNSNTLSESGMAAARKSYRKQMTEDELAVFFDPQKDLNTMTQNMTDALLGLFSQCAVRGIMRYNPRVEDMTTGTTKEDVKNATKHDTACAGMHNTCMVNYYNYKSVENLDARNVTAECSLRTSLINDYTPPPCEDQIDQQPYERLVMIDMRKTKKQIMDEIEYFVDRTHEMSKAHANSHDNVEYRNYANWQTDKDRYRKEAWTQLKIWRLWKTGQGYKRIAREIDMTVDAVKQAFHKAYERIYNKPYDCMDVWKNEREIEKPDIEQFHKDCQNKPCETCKKPCREYLEYIEAHISQDHVSRKESYLIYEPT